MTKKKVVEKKGALELHSENHYKFNFNFKSLRKNIAQGIVQGFAAIVFSFVLMSALTSNDWWGVALSGVMLALLLLV